MPTDAATTSRVLGSMSKTFARMDVLLKDLGVNLSIWDADRNRADEFDRRCEFCRVLGAPGGPCVQAARTVAGKVLTDEAPAKGRCELGCCVIGVPIRHRRRLVGAAVGCMPVKDMLDEEVLARLCDRMHLDRQAVLAMVQPVRRGCAEAVNQMLPVLGQMLDNQHALQVAQEELATLSDNLANTYEELSLLYRISGSMRVTQQPREFLQNVCDELLEVMNIAEASVVVKAHPPGSGEDVVVRAGQIKLDDVQITDLASRSIVPRFDENKRVILENSFSPAPGGAGDGIAKLIAVALTIEDEIIGVMVGLNKIDGDFDSVDVKLINSIANQAAVFLANSRLYADLQDLLMGVLHALTATIDAKDPYTCGHSQRVAMISRRLAAKSGFNPQKVQQVYLAGLLHDIGKIGVPEATLCKEGRLTDEEYDGMKRHPDLGAKILGGIRQLDDVIAGIRCHHERPDGRGYPAGLKGSEVPIEGLIVGLADGFDAMTSDRTYRKALPLDVVVQEIRSHAGTQFHPDLVETLLSMDLEELLREIHAPVRDFLPAALAPEKSE